MAFLSSYGVCCVTPLGGGGDKVQDYRTWCGVRECSKSVKIVGQRTGKCNRLQDKGSEDR